jgi:predicted RNA-binding Zn-ribbon protein involved in translation (DUF1610 family)
MSKAKAPRRKATAKAPPKELRGTKLTVDKRVCNDGKWASLEPMFGRVCSLKNKMSAYAHKNILSVLIDPYQLKSDYKVFPSLDLNAWERQALFQDIVGDYQKTVVQHLSANPFRVQQSWSYQVYKRDVTRTFRNGRVEQIAITGDVKAGTFVLSHRSTTLTGLANYLMRVNIALFNPELMAMNHPLREDFLRLRNDVHFWNRLTLMARQRQVRILCRVRKSRYVTGTFRVNPAQSGTSVYTDVSNKQHQLWLKLRMGLGESKTFLHLPIHVNKARLRAIAAGDIANLGLATEMRLKFCSGRKLHVCTTYEAKSLEFMPENKSIGVDLNTKRSFANDNLSRVYQLDQLVLAAGLALLSKVDAEGGVSKMGYRRAAQLRQWMRWNEAHIKKLLAGWCKEWKHEGITDVWLEDLSMSGDATMLRHPTLGAQKYSRVLRMLRLSAVKNWMYSIGEKLGIRVHTTDAAFSSQECPECHHVARANRPKQEVFDCVSCGFEGDADHVAGVNLNNRSSSELRTVLHTTDKYGRCSPRPIRRSMLKALLMAQSKSLKPAGGVTELPTPA